MGTAGVRAVNLLQLGDNQRKILSIYARLPISEPDKANNRLIGNRLLGRLVVKVFGQSFAQNTAGAHRRVIDEKMIDGFMMRLKPDVQTQINIQYVKVQIQKRSEHIKEPLEQWFRRIPYICEICHLRGDDDYLLKTTSPNVSDIDPLVDFLNAQPFVVDAGTLIVRRVLGTGHDEFDGFFETRPMSEFLKEFPGEFKADEE